MNVRERILEKVFYLKMVLSQKELVREEARNFVDMLSHAAVSAGFALLCAVGSYIIYQFGYVSDFLRIWGLLVVGLSIVFLPIFLFRLIELANESKRRTDALLSRLDRGGDRKR